MLTKKNFFFYIIFCYLQIVFCFGFAQDRLSSYPYVSGDTFRAAAHYIVDETGFNIAPKNVKYGDLIFVKTDYLNVFFHRFHPKIGNSYILITHNSDYPAPGKYANYLEDPKILAWFAQNMDIHHPKLHPIPIGMANRYWPHGSIENMKEIQLTLPSLNKDILLYMNFAISTYPSERKLVYNLFKDKDFCEKLDSKDHRSYLCDLARSKFVLSPRGNGLDCHRTWEALLLGAIPIIKTCSLDPLYKELPVIIVKDWREINLEFLEKKWIEMSAKTYNLKKLYADYWLQFIMLHAKKQ